METTKTEKEFSFEEFKTNLHHFIKNNYGGCSSFLEPILEAKDENKLKGHFRDYNNEVFDYLGGDSVDEDDVKELEREIRDLEYQVYDLEAELETKDGALDGTLMGEYKLQHFIQYKDEYTETELEELLKNGKKYLQK